MPRGRADVFGNVGEKRNDIVVGGALDLANALDVELRAALDSREVFTRNLPGLTSQNLNLEPDGELVLLRPNLAHHLAAVPANHDAMRLRTLALVVNAGGNDNFKRRRVNGERTLGATKPAGNVLRQPHA